MTGSQRPTRASLVEGCGCKCPFENQRNASSVEAKGATTSSRYEAKVGRLASCTAGGAEAMRAAEASPASSSQPFKIESRRVSIASRSAVDRDFILLLISP